MSAEERRMSPSRNAPYTGCEDAIEGWKPTRPRRIILKSSFNVVSRPLATLNTGECPIDRLDVAARILACATFATWQKSRLDSPSPRISHDPPLSRVAIHFGIT